MTISFRISPASARRAERRSQVVTCGQLRWAQPFPRTGCVLLRESIIRSLRRVAQSRPSHREVSSPRDALAHGGGVGVRPVRGGGAGVSNRLAAPADPLLRQRRVLVDARHRVLHGGARHRPPGRRPHRRSQVAAELLEAVRRRRGRHRSLRSLQRLPVLRRAVPASRTARSPVHCRRPDSVRQPALAHVLHGAVAAAPGACDHRGSRSRGRSDRPALRAQHARRRCRRDWRDLAAVAALRSRRHAVDWRGRESRLRVDGPAVAPAPGLDPSTTTSPERAVPTSREEGSIAERWQPTSSPGPPSTPSPVSSRSRSRLPGSDCSASS